MKNRKLFIILSVLVALLLFVVIIFWAVPAKKNSPSAPNAYQPEFLSDSEKQALNLPLETKVQSLGRNKEGKVTVYRIINDDSQIILDPSKIGPISPRQR